MSGADSELASERVIEADAAAELLDGVIELIRRHLEARWEGFLHGASLTPAGEVISSLVWHQADLAIAFLESSVLWRGTVSHVLLRSMIETHINLAWILRDPHDRSEKFVDYGLGRMKLALERYRRQVEQSGLDPKDDETYQGQLAWLESQRLAMLTEVNVGSWSGKSTREMAQDADLLDLYDGSYDPLSAAVHAQWHHVGIANSRLCRNPLHGMHRVPALNSSEDFMYAQEAVGHLTKSLEELDEWSAFQPSLPYPSEWFANAVAEAATNAAPS